MQSSECRQFCVWGDEKKVIICGMIGFGLSLPVLGEFVDFFARILPRAAGSYTSTPYGELVVPLHVRVLCLVYITLVTQQR
ncbi:hypothetical protein J3F84DRAFT_362097 [Trichoderma pleuroticola]